MGYFVLGNDAEMFVLGVVFDEVHGKRFVTNQQC